MQAQPARAICGVRCAFVGVGGRRFTTLHGAWASAAAGAATNAARAHASRAEALAAAQVEAQAEAKEHDRAAIAAAALAERHGERRRSPSKVVVSRPY